MGGGENGRIATSDGKAPADAEAAAYGEAYDGRGKLLVPAFYNAHAHAPMTLLRGLRREPAPAGVARNDMVWPFEGKMTPEDNYWGTLLACAEMARYGVRELLRHVLRTDERVRAVGESWPEGEHLRERAVLRAHSVRGLRHRAAVEDYIKKYHGALDGRILVDYNIHAEYTSNEQTCRDIAEVAKAAGLRMHLHLSETKSEHEECKQRHGGMTPAAYFASIGVFDVPTIAAHCVWCEPATTAISWWRTACSRRSTPRRT